MPATTAPDFEARLTSASVPFKGRSCIRSLYRSQGKVLRTCVREIAIQPKGSKVYWLLDQLCDVYLHLQRSMRRILELRNQNEETFVVNIGTPVSGAGFANSRRPPTDRQASAHCRTDQNPGY